MNFIAVRGVTAQPVANPQKSSFLRRLLSVVVLAPPVLAAIYSGGVYFNIMIALAAVLMAWEWRRMCAGAVKRGVWLVAGFLYVALPCISLVWLRSDIDIGRETVFWVFLLVWATDIGAYVFGLLIGGPRLVPVISPKKTWAGLLGGITCAGAVGAIMAIVIARDTLMPLAIISVVMGILAQAGDLLESWFKRHFALKDTSNIIPGHGGILDRVDGLLVVSLAVALIALVHEGSVLTWL